MSEDLKDMLERAFWTFVQAFLGALTISPMVGVDANALQIAAISGGSAALSVIKTYAMNKVK
ncbi:MAG: holin [Burkholderiaceae bacterium]|jgi:hypothetical protein